ncbi:MAG: hypothetical protein IT385_19655 [Deltaproteobacteria bacterium]|nr:hypothetical protein [Deltaproteobacteria bacterium]
MTTAGPTLHVAFLWHMHQPSYRDPVTGEVLLPWVRLHGVKDYTDMLTAMRLCPGARATVNWVPGLLDQADALAASDYGARERFWRLTDKPAHELSPSEVAFVRQHFFSLGHRHMLEPHPRYRELHHKVRGGEALTVAELRDLQIWFNLAWCGVTLQAEPAVAALIARGRDFTEADKAPLLEAQRAAVLALTSRWKALQDAGQVELSVSPYYHPILPLLVDSDLARAADPTSPLPASRFAWRGDAEVHVKKAVASHERRFGAPPRGMWPSEGSVAAAVLPVFRQAGLQWVVTDEAILAATLRGSGAGQLQPPGQPGSARPSGEFRGIDKFRPWTLDGVTVFFRDHGLSDRIGFVYASWPHERAWADMRAALLSIQRGLAADGAGDGVVVIALDGENCWEHYAGGITAFLPGLYQTILDTPGLSLVTLSEAAAAVPARPLPGLAAGSWIDGTFRTWLGDPVKNRAWELLTAARQAAHRPMDKLLSNEPGLADLVMRAEASDWWWWFGEGHSSTFDMDFDALFRAHLQAIWLALGKGVPAILQTSVYAQAGQAPGAITQRQKRPRTQLAPAVDGKKSWYYKWIGAGEVLQTFGSIHRAESIARRLLYGNDEGALVLRLDATDRCDRALAGLGVELVLPQRTLTLWPAHPPADDAAPPIVAVMGEVFEARVPLELLGVHELPARVRGHLEIVDANGAPLERFPGMGDLELELLSGLEAALNRGV